MTCSIYFPIGTVMCGGVHALHTCGVRGQFCGHCSLPSFMWAVRMALSGGHSLYQWARSLASSTLTFQWSLFTHWRFSVVYFYNSAKADGRTRVEWGACPQTPWEERRGKTRVAHQHYHLSKDRRVRRDQLTHEIAQSLSWVSMPTLRTELIWARQEAQWRMCLCWPWWLEPELGTHEARGLTHTASSDLSILWHTHT